MPAYRVLEYNAFMNDEKQLFGGPDFPMQSLTTTSLWPVASQPGAAIPSPLAQSMVFF